MKRRKTHGRFYGPSLEVAHIFWFTYCWLYAKETRKCSLAIFPKKGEKKSSMNNQQSLSKQRLSILVQFLIRLSVALKGGVFFGMALEGGFFFSLQKSLMKSSLYLGHGKLLTNCLSCTRHLHNIIRYIPLYFSIIYL